MLYLWILLGVEFVFRLLMEIRECRLTQMGGGVFTVLRLIPLVNDIVPLPENRREPEVGAFVSKHEEGHKKQRHGILRNIFKVILLMLAVWFFAFQLTRNGMPLWVAILWLHLVAIPFRVIFHLYCWGQEFEADAYALKQLDKHRMKGAMRELAECEIPHSRFFAMLYREHPTVDMRKKRLQGAR